MEESLIKRLIASLKCSTCGQCYDTDSITVIGHREDLWFLRVSCLTCHTQYLVATLISESKASEINTELTEAEIAGLINADAITADELLDMRNFLNGFDGDFSRLFGREVGSE